MRDQDGWLFRLEGNTLVCPEDMNPVPPGVFRKWCDDLLAVDGERIVIDMSATFHILSQHIGIVANTWSDAVAAGKNLVVRASDQVKVVLQATGLAVVLEVAEE